MDALADKDNYVLEDTEGDGLEAISDVSVDEDNKVVTLTLEADVANQTDGVLVIDSDVTGDKVEEEVNFFDTTIPEVDGVSVVGKDTVKVKFSEPIDLDTDEDGFASSSIEDEFEVKIGDKTYIVDTVQSVANGTEANVKVYGSFEEGTLM